MKLSRTLIASLQSSEAEYDLAITCNGKKYQLVKENGFVAVYNWLGSVLGFARVTPNIDDWIYNIIADNAWETEWWREVLKK